MRRFDASEARDYVERFTPFDTAGSYRLEDGDAMAPLAPFVTSVVAEHDSGVLGLPLPSWPGCSPNRRSPGRSGRSATLSGDRWS